ncbi:hypothetical protein [Nonomuraea sp. NPDC003214]
MRPRALGLLPLLPIREPPLMDGGDDPRCGGPEEHPQRRFGGIHHIRKGVPDRVGDAGAVGHV